MDSGTLRLFIHFDFYFAGFAFRRIFILPLFVFGKK